MSGDTATDVIIARVAAIICEETCGLTSECKSREAARALMAKGLLSNSHAELVKALEEIRRMAIAGFKGDEDGDSMLSNINNLALETLAKATPSRNQVERSAQ